MRTSIEVGILIAAQLSFGISKIKYLVPKKPSLHISLHFASRWILRSLIESVVCT
jgi:hypothetical protein